MGRSNVTPQKFSVVDTGGKHKFLVVDNKSQLLFDCKVPMIDGCYDSGSAYWGLGAELRVEYTKDLSYIRFYRLGRK